MENKCHALEEEKRGLENKSKQEIEGFKDKVRDEMDSLQLQCAKTKGELNALHDFTVKKDDMEQQLRHYKQLLEKKELEYRDTIHNLERKVLQDKNRMKREMLQKLNEAVANFRRVADKQMAETTKRAIRENMAISSQLKKMSVKVMEMVAENDTLHAKVNKLKINNSLLTESEKELVKRNYTNQKVIKMLVEKLKGFKFNLESDQMLEVAFEMEQEKQEMGANYDSLGRPILTDKIKEEMEALQYDYNVLAARLSEIVVTTSELEMIHNEANEAAKHGNGHKVVVEYLETNVGIVLTRLKALTTFEVMQGSVKYFHLV